MFLHVEAAVTDWERRLTEEALAVLADNAATPIVEIDPRPLDQAHRKCAEITARSSRTFYLASGLLPPGKRRAMRALYAFCRSTDDIVDRCGADAPDALERWKRLALGAFPPPDELVAVAWAQARRRYGIPQAYAERLVRGVAQDLAKARYADFDELVEYCYGVASTVGLMAMHIVGFDGPAAVPYAIRLGVALQLTNILRDVAEDWRRGRLYLPQDELAAFDLTEEHVAEAEVNDRWRQFMGFQIARNRGLYEDAWPGIALLHRDGRFAVAAAADLYAAILGDIERHRYDVFSRRAYVSRWAKLRRLPSIWYRVKRLPSAPRTSQAST